MTESNLSVTIVTPAYNEEDNIRAYLESLKRQSWRDFDVLVIDDGSTDSTAAIVKEYYDQLRLTLIRSPHIGWKLAKAQGTASVTTDICIVFDADNIIDLRCVENLVKPFVDDPRVGAVGGRIKSYGSTWVVCGTSLVRELLHRFRKTSSGEAWVLIGQCMAFRTSVLKAVGGLTEADQMVGQDVEISWRLHSNGVKIACRDDAIVYHREPTAVAGLFKRQFTFGRKAVYTYWLHKNVWLNWKSWVRFYPLALSIILPFYPVVAIVFFAGTLPGALWLFRKANTPLIDKFYGWAVLTIHSTAYTLGFITELFRSVRDFLFKRTYASRTRA